MAPGAAGNRPALGAPAPLSPPPRVRLGASVPPRACNPGGAGALEERKLTCLSRGRKKFGSHPLPQPLSAPDSSGRGAGRACALGFVLRTRPGGGGEGAGLPSPHRPPQSCAQTPCWPPPAPETARFARGRLGSGSACPRDPARRNFLRVAGPTRPASLARLGVTDASETDFPLFQRKRELARAPRLPQLRDLPAAPTRSCHSRGAPPRLGRGGGWGGYRRLATCTFETKQTRPPRAHPGPGQGRPSTGVGS